MLLTVIFLYCFLSGTENFLLFLLCCKCLLWMSFGKWFLSTIEMIMWFVIYTIIMIVATLIGFIFFIFIFLLCNTVLVLPYIDMNPPQVYMSSQPWIPLLPPFPYHLSESSQCTRPKHPVSCIEPRLVCMFQCHSPKSSHALPLPQSPKFCSLHLCLFCCITYRVIITIFLNSIYMH